jgi:hypothetical protein
MRYDSLPLSALNSLCTSLHLEILCIGEDMSFMYKYQDVVSGYAETVLDNGSGYIE